MAIKAGRLRHRITFQNKTTTRDDYGGEVETWADVTTVWASLDPLSTTAMAGAKEFLGGGAEQASDMVRATIRPREVDTAWRFIHGSKLYNIKAARTNNVDDTMQIFAEVGANDG